MFVIEAAGEPVGELWFGERVTEFGRCLWIYRALDIERAWRGRGHGRAAMLRAEAEARSLGFGRLGLDVSAGNEIARNLYQSLGYAENAISMSKPI